MKSLCVFALLLVAATANAQFQRQRQNWGPNQDPNQNWGQIWSTGAGVDAGQESTASPSTTQRTTVVTTASPRYLACLQACPATSQYNPICGSDNINYHNEGRLNCAIQCGQNVQAVRSGTCNPL